MNKNVVTIIIAVIFFVLIFMGLRFLSGEDDWICENGEWVKHGQPSDPPPAIECLN